MAQWNRKQNKRRTKATLRCIPLEQRSKKVNGATGKPSKQRVLFAKLLIFKKTLAIPTLIFASAI